MRADDPQARAVLHLAQSLYDYGQHERTLALLDLYDWLRPRCDAPFDLRVSALIKLRRLDEAKALCEATPSPRAARHLAEVYWGLGDKTRGDSYFRQSQLAE
ncbi:MAG: hypothetical protein AAFN94_17690 [Pseudomonadota bacterium]